MEINVVTIDHGHLWQQAFDRLPPEEQEPGFIPDWYRIFSQQGFGEAWCCIATQNEALALYPFLKNSINDLGYELDKPYFDIQGAPGYNGIASNTIDPVFFAELGKAFSAWCTSEKIVTEFTRFNPITSDHIRIAPEWCQQVNDNIIVDLKDDEGSGYMNSLNNRKKRYLRKAEREGILFQCVTGESISETQLEEFVSVYHRTMRRNNADDEFDHGISFFRDVATLMGSHARFYFAMMEGIAVSVELVIRGSLHGYSWLGGTLDHYFDLRPNLFLKSGIIKDLTDKELTHFCLGGGQQPGDGIFVYKKSFAPEGIRPFYIGKRVHQPEVYQEIVRQWQHRFPELYQKNKRRVLGYRNLEL